VIADLKHHLADVEIEGRNLNKADVKITICDKLNQPYYIIEKYNVSYEGFITSDYRARGELIATKTFHKVPYQKAKNRKLPARS
jgi:xylose isomerase